MSSSALNSFQAVTFDVGGTLIDPWPSVGHVYAEVAARLGLSKVDPDRLNIQFNQAWQARGSFDYSKDSWRRIVQSSFAGLLRESEIGALFEPLFDHFGFPKAWRLQEEVVPVFRALRARGLLLGIISNWDDRLKPLLARFGLLPFLEVVIVSCEVGHTKPAPEIFHQAAAGLRLAPHRIVHVGDSLVEDVAGASAAGLQPVLIRRPPAGPGAHSGRVIMSLTELLD
jgi:putative hydrolase of the HAD superfamily